MTDYTEERGVIDFSCRWDGRGEVILALQKLSRALLSLAIATEKDFPGKAE
jgi:hypothetical protein